MVKYVLHLVLSVLIYQKKVKHFEIPDHNTTLIYFTNFFTVNDFDAEWKIILPEREIKKLEKSQS